ncbi:MAG: glycosyltransferase family 4 protein [Planctomycetes bacterium]|nr:glycosyltransferase family 4 protein [Planctomycetota bacterium]
MKICYASSMLNWQDERILRAISDAGHDVVLVTFYNRGEIPEMISAIPRLTIEHERLQYFPGHAPEISSAKPGRLKRMLGFKRDVDRAVLFLEAMIEKHRPDLLHGGWLQTEGYVSACQEFHPYLQMTWGSDILLAPDGHPRDRYFALKAIRSADAILCDAEASKKKILSLVPRYPPNEIVHFPYGIDLAKFSPDASAELGDSLFEPGRTIIVTRSHEPVYDLGTLIDALISLHREGANFKALFFGGGSLTDALKYQAGEAGFLGTKLHFLGRVANDVLPAYLARGDVYVSPALSDGSSCSLLEALACGCPAVVCDVPAIMEWVTDEVNGFVVPKSDAGTMAARIRTLLENSELREKMRADAIETARTRADWRKHAKTLNRIYECLKDRKSISGETVSDSA